MPILWQQPRIITEHIYPPIQDRSVDWSAALEGYEPGDAIGYGPTEQAAIADLQQQLNDE